MPNAGTPGRPLTLAQALDLAVRNYPSIRGKLAERQATEADLAGRRASFLPSASLGAQALYGTSNNVRGAAFSNEGTTNSVSSGIKPGGPTANAVWTSLGSLNINWRAVTFGRNKADLAVAKSAIGRANADYQQELFVHQVRVIDAYLTALVIDQTVNVQAANLNRVSALQTVMRANTRSGRRPGVDSVLADAEVAKARLLLLESRRMAEQQRVQLGQWLGQPDAQFQLDTATYQGGLPPTLVGSTDQLINHPTLAFFRRQIDVSQAQAEAIRRTYLPTISLNTSFWARGSGVSDVTTPEGSFIYNSSPGAGLPFRVANYFVGVSTLWRFSDVLRTRQETKAQELRAVADQQRYDEEALRLRAQLQTSELQLQNAYEAARQAPVQLQAAQAAFGQAQARYTAGLFNIFEYTQVFTLLNRAEIDQLVTVNNVWRALLLKAAAQGDLSGFTAPTTR
ncbi:TolC family protein [Fibrella sp. HMF5335]|uniref:TolC family protein n=2 Tax=Fibrella rubiginis TaxID=2817060 RepID=A0A939GGH2_9BACT|nr:TolC family protein [Fibrella rubiginis]